MNKTSPAPIVLSTLAILIGIIAMFIATVSAPKASDSVSLGAEKSNATTTVGSKYAFSNDVFFSDSVRLGAVGTQLSHVNAGTCYIKPYSATIAASTTQQVDCQATLAWGASGASALTGVTFADNVQITLATSTAGTLAEGLKVSGAAASSTSGYIVLYIVNETGTTYTWPVTLGTASGTASYIATR